jgi:hypothetical protein
MSGILDVNVHEIKVGEHEQRFDDEEFLND